MQTSNTKVEEPVEGCASECRRICPVLFVPFELTSNILYTLSDITACPTAQRPMRDILDRIFGRERTGITEIENILENPEKYNGKNVTVEGVLGNRPYSIRRGDIWGIYDKDGNALQVEMLPDYEYYAEMAGSDVEKYYELLQNRYSRINSLRGKTVRTKGVVVTIFMDKMREPSPTLLFYEQDIEVVEPITHT